MDDVRIVVCVMEFMNGGRFVYDGVYEGEGLYNKKRSSHNARENLHISIILYGYDDKKIFRLC